MHKKLQANENILWLMLGLALLLLWVAIMLVQLREGTVEVLKTAKGSGSWPRSTRRKPPQKKPVVPMPPRRIFCAA